MNQPQAIIEASHLYKRFGTNDADLVVLHDIHLRIAKGEFVAIMGPSGSGKSTLLTILGGIELPSEGEVIIESVNLADLNDNQRTLFRRRRLGFVFQAFNLIPTISAQENVSLPMELDGQPRSVAMKKANELLQLVEMDHRLQQLPGRLSGGEQQRVAIARALIMEPAILFADEPTGNLDSRQGNRISSILRDLSRERQQTIVMVTHDAKVAEVANRHIVMKDGRVDQDSAPYPSVSQEINS